MSCPNNPPPPQVGDLAYSVWRGKVPPELQQWAAGLLKTVSKHPYGYIWRYGSTTTLARLDHHTWHFKPDGTLLTNLCWPGITLYRPTAQNIGDAGAPVLDPATAKPDPLLAVYDSPPDQTNWALVAVTGGVLGLVVGMFWLALRQAGRPKRVRA